MRPIPAPTSLAVREALLRLLAGQDLSRLQVHQAVASLLAGEATAAQVGALAAVLRLKRAADEELAALLEACRGRVQRVSRAPSPLLSCGSTGSEELASRNVFSAVALVSSAAGLPALESVQSGSHHGSGSAGLLEALRVPLDRDAADLSADLARTGVAFASVVRLLPGLRHLLGDRLQLGFTSAFQVLAALLDPADADVHLLGGHDAQGLERVARLLGRFGSTRGWVVRGLDGLDALSPSAPSEVASLEPDGHVRLFTVTPEDAGLTRAPPGSLEGGSPAEQARSLRALLAGEEGPLRSAVLLNVAAALLVAGRAPSLRQGAGLAARAIDSGAAMGKLAALTGG